MCSDVSILRLWGRPRTPVECPGLSDGSGVTSRCLSAFLPCFPPWPSRLVGLLLGLSSSLPLFPVCPCPPPSVCLFVFLFLSGGASASSVLASPLVLWGRPCGSPCLVCPWGLGESGIIVDDDEDVLEVRWLLPLAQGFASFRST